MASIATLEATLKANTRDFKAGMDEAIRATESMNKKMGLLSVAAGVQLVQAFAQGAQQIIQFGKELYNVGVQSEAAGARYRAVFGDNTAALDEWVEANRTAFGQATDDMQGMVAQVANMLIPLGLTTEAAGEQATKILELAAAWSSYSGGAVSAEQAADALTKGVMGQTRGLLELGMNAKMVQQVEQVMGGETDNLAAAMGRLDEITRQSGAAMQVHEEMMGGALGAQREMETAMNELKDAAGALVVKLAPLVTLLAQIVGFAADVVTGMGDFGGRIDELASGLTEHLGAIGQAILDADGDVDTMRQSLSDLGVSGGDLDLLISKLDTELAPALEAAGDAVGLLADSVFPDWQDTLEDSGDTIRNLGPDYEQLIEQLDRQNRATGDVIDATERLNDLRRAAVDPLFAVVDATGRLGEAQADLAEAMATGDVEAAAAATERLYRAQLDLDEASGQLDMRDAVGQLTGILTEAGLTADQIQRIIDTINTLNQTPVTNPFGVHDVLPGGGGPLIGGRASGGPVATGQTAIVGEAGPELLVARAGGVDVIPFGKIPKMAGGGFVQEAAYGPAGGFFQESMIQQAVYGGPGGGFGQQAAYGPPTVGAGALPPSVQASFKNMGWQVPYFSGGAGGAGMGAALRGVGNNINVYVTVEGSIRSDRELAKVVEQELVRAIRRGGASALLS